MSKKHDKNKKSKSRVACSTDIKQESTSHDTAAQYGKYIFFNNNADMLSAGAAVLFFSLQLLITDKYFFGSGTDMVSMEYPLHSFAAQWMSQGVLPLWNHTIFGGVPFQAGVHGYLYPGFWTALIFNTGFDIKLSIVLHLVLAAMGGAWFARTRCSHVLPRCFLGIVYGLSGFLILHLFAGHRVLVITAAYLPFIAGAADRLVRLPTFYSNKRLLVKSILFSALMILSGHYQMIFISAIGIFLWLTADRILNAEPNLRIKTLIRSTASIAILFIAGAMIAAVQLLPSIATAELSQRTGEDYSFAASFSASPLALITYLFPNFFGNRVDASFVGDFAFWESVGYFGIFPFLAVIIACTLLPFKKWAPHILIIIIALVLTLGAHTPLFDIYLKIVPGATMFRSPGRYTLLITLFGAHLGAMFLNELLLDRFSKAKLRISVFVVWGFAALVTLFTAWFYLSDTSLEFYRACCDKGALLSSESLVALMDVALSDMLKASALLIGCSTVYSILVLCSVRKTVLAALLILLTLWDLNHYGKRFMITKTPDKFSFPTEIAKMLDSESKPGLRIIPPAESRLTNYPATINASNPGGYDIFIDAEYAEYLNRSQGRKATAFLSMEKLKRGSHLLSRMGAEYLITSSKLVNGQNRFVSGFTNFEFVSKAGGYYLYRDPLPNPRAILVHEIEVVADKEIAYQKLSSPNFNMQRTALLDDSLPDDFTPPLPYNQGAETAQIMHLSPNRVEIDVRAETDAVLVISDSFMTGWSATVNGKAAPIVRANQIMRAVPCPKGEYTVVMTYLPASFIIGAIVSIISIIAISAVGFYYSLGDRVSSPLSKDIS